MGLEEELGFFMDLLYSKVFITGRGLLVPESAILFEVAELMFDGKSVGEWEVDAVEETVLLFAFFVIFEYEMGFVLVWGASVSL